MERPPTEWSKSYFRTRLESDILLKNLCEVSNKMLIDDKKKMIVTMLTDMELEFMTMIENRQSKVRMYRGQLFSRIKKLAKIDEMSNECIFHFLGRPKWQVDCRLGTYVIDLEEQSCVCRRWDLMEYHVVLP